MARKAPTGRLGNDFRNPQPSGAPGRLKSPTRPEAGMKSQEVLEALLLLLPVLAALLAPRPAPRPAAASNPKGMGFILLLEGKNAEALRLLNLALSESPRDAEALLLRGHAHARLGKYTEALRDMVDAARLDPGLRPLLPPIAMLALRLGRLASLRLLALAWRSFVRLGVLRGGLW